MLVYPTVHLATTCYTHQPIFFIFRSQPVAQAQFFTEGGIHTLTRLFDSSLQKTEPQIHKPQLKAVTLIEDLIEEKVCETCRGGGGGVQLFWVIMHERNLSACLGKNSDMYL